ncbi:HAMP domain-containing histidine kinase [bacterium]|nr:MAG: HAMP domain-containing histidine kinase [bacterium]
MKLKHRLLLLVFGVLIISASVTWFGIKPAYETALVEERIEKVSQLHTQILNEADIRIRDWVNVLADAGVALNKNPESLQSVLETYIRLFPDIVFLRIVDPNTGVFTQIKQLSSGYNTIEDNWKIGLVESNTVPNLAFNWLFEQNLLYLTYSFEAQSTTLVMNVLIQDSDIFKLITEVPVSEKTQVAVWKQGIPIYSNQKIEDVNDIEPSSLQRVVKQESGHILTYNSFSIAPYQYGITVLESDIIAPIESLFNRSLIILLISMLVIGVGAVIVTSVIEKPIATLAQEIEPFGNYSFENAITISSLPDLKPLSLIIEEIRQKLHHYQKINIDKIISEEERNRLLMRYANQMVAILDENDNFVFTNEKLEYFFEEIAFSLPNNWSALEKNSLITEEQRERRKNTSSDTGLFYTVMDWQAKTIDRRAYHFKVYKLDIRNAENNGSLIIFYDLTTELSMDIKRNELISIIVHELKNPVASIIGFSQLIQSALSDKDREKLYVEYILNSASEMNELISRFLQISKLESKAIQLEKSPIFVRGILQQIEDSFQAAILEHNITLDISVDDDSQFIFAAESLTIDAIRNLVSNAIKYGDDSRTIRIEVKRHNQFICLSITDYGFGIPQDALDKVFDKFYRVKSTQSLPGTGLGLAYVKEIMERHSGKVRVESEPEFGARFILYFPIDEELDEISAEIN